jgi:hypothetical protein
LKQTQRSPNAEVISAVIPGSKRAPGESGDDVVKVAPAGSGLVAALADGAGSAARGRYGAEIAAAAAVESVGEALGHPGKASANLDEVLAAAMAEAHRALLIAAANSCKPIELRDLATTLSVAVVAREQIGIAAIGDGIQIVRGVDGRLNFAAMAPDTEIANHSDFLTSPDALARTLVEVYPAPEIESVLLSSDGLDPYLVDRRDDQRWPLQAPVTALLNAPVLEGWGAGEFETLLDSEVIRQHSDDDLSLAVLRRLERPKEGALRVGRFLLSRAPDPRPGCRAWNVAGCSSLLAILTDPPLPVDVAIASRDAQILDRGSRRSPVNWPVRWIEGGLILVQRIPRRVPLATVALRCANRGDADQILRGMADSVEALHRSGLSHGRLSSESFLVYPDRTVVLWEPGPGMFEGADQNALGSSDREFVAALSVSSKSQMRGVLGDAE